MSNAGVLQWTRSTQLKRARKNEETVIVSADLRYNEETEAAMREARDIVAGRLSAARYGSAAEAFGENDDNRHD